MHHSKGRTKIKLGKVHFPHRGLMHMPQMWSAKEHLPNFLRTYNLGTYYRNKEGNARHLSFYQGKKTFIAP